MYNKELVYEKKDVLYPNIAAYTVHVHSAFWLFTGLVANVSIDIQMQVINIFAALDHCIS